jgi:hypothetical protein
MAVKRQLSRVVSQESPQHVAMGCSMLVCCAQQYAPEHIGHKTPSALGFVYLTVVAVWSTLMLFWQRHCGLLRLPNIQVV